MRKRGGLVTLLGGGLLFVVGIVLQLCSVPFGLSVSMVGVLIGIVSAGLLRDRR